MEQKIISETSIKRTLKSVTKGSLNQKQEINKTTAQRKHSEVKVKNTELKHQSRQTQFLMEPLLER